MAEPLINKFRIGIVGHGFVGKAVDYGFETPDVKKFLVDPKYDTTIDDLVEFNPNIVFVCTPTPMAEDGSVDSTATEDAVLKIIKKTNAGVILKSTLPPQIIDRLAITIAIEKAHDRFVYNPEFLTENSALEQFINSPVLILGGTREACAAASMIYSDFSMCVPGELIVVSAVEASFIKYGINSFLAMKVTFFNQLYDAVKDFGGSYHQIANAIGRDPRVGTSHTRVPGFDFKRGFGGACFPKDLQAFVDFSDKLTLLEKCININNDYRIQYELGEREKEQNVNYGEVEEEQQDQDNGSSS